MDNTIRCYRDSHGFPRVSVDRGHPNIGAFLEQDVQGSVDGAKEYLTIAEDVEQGRRSDWTGTGNAHTVTIQPGRVAIENIWDEDLGIAELSIEQFKHSLRQWLACIT